MKTLEHLDDYVAAMEAARALGRTVGLVPTMGALHAGHRSLVERARTECETVAVSIFVNPLQFGEREDLENYPRSAEEDLDQCEQLGVDYVLAPSVAAMYPAWPEPVATKLVVAEVSEGWEGAARPGHFDGVATVVAKLFALTGRCRAYFGEKDFQQLAVVRTMAADIGFPVEVVGCPTVRAADGVALSSRNARLSPEQRRAARSLPAALEAGRRAVASGERQPAVVSAAMADVVAREPLAALDYAAVVDARDLTVPPALDASSPLRLLIAARIGPVRLIDNCGAGDDRSDGPIGYRPATGAARSAQQPSPCL